MEHKACCLLGIREQVIAPFGLWASGGVGGSHNCTWVQELGTLGDGSVVSGGWFWQLRSCSGNNTCFPALNKSKSLEWRLDSVEGGALALSPSRDSLGLCGALGDRETRKRPRSQKCQGVGRSGHL